MIHDVTRFASPFLFLAPCFAWSSLTATKFRDQRYHANHLNNLLGSLAFLLGFEGYFAGVMSIFSPYTCYECM